MTVARWMTGGHVSANVNVAAFYFLGPDESGFDKEYALLREDIGRHMTLGESSTALLERICRRIAHLDARAGEMALRTDGGDGSPTAFADSTVHRDIQMEAPSNAFAGSGAMAALEFYHVDSTYRNAYYSHYSSQHFDVSRWALRLSFFDASLCGKVRSSALKSAAVADGAISLGDFSIDEWATLSTQVVQDAFLGSMVLCPTLKGYIGRTLLAPSRVSDAMGARRPSRIRVRLSTFELNVAGKKLHVRAFPFHEQDHLLMSCAEVTLLNLVRYYANEYDEYRTIEPDDILDAERKTVHSRLVPTTGLSYSDLCAVLTQFGFQPELYDGLSIGGSWLHPLSPDRAFKRVLHTYISSGIPLAVNVAPPDDAFAGHSLVCVGCALPDDLEKAIDEADSNALVLEPEIVKQPIGSVRASGKMACCRVLDSADLHDRYVVIDDNQIPYAIRPVGMLSEHANMVNARIIAALQRGMTVEAVDARKAFQRIMVNPGQGLLSWCGEWLDAASVQRSPNGQTGDRMDDEVRVVSRMFLASSRRFKTYRVATLMSAGCDIERIKAYISVPLPHYVWVCEFMFVSEYLKFATMPQTSDLAAQGLDELGEDVLRRMPMAFAEYVVDATADIKASAGSSMVVLSHFPEKLGIRMPGVASERMLSWRLSDGATDFERFGGFPCFIQNLETVDLN